MKIDDIVTLVVDGQEFDAKVERVYEGQTYVDLRTLAGGAGGGVAYQTVMAEPKGDVESTRYFKAKTAAEKKEMKAEADVGTETVTKDLAPGAKRDK